MTTIRRFLFRLLSFARPGRAEQDLHREISAHLQLLEDSFVAQGMRPEDARFAARRAFGGVEQAKEHQRDTRSFRWLDDSRIDFKLGARMLMKNPGLSVIGGLGLAVAIAVGTAFFSFFHAYLASTLPVDDGDRIVGIENWDLKRNNESQRSMHDFLTWREQLTTVQDIGAFRSIGRNLTVPGGSAQPIQIAEMTAAGFDITRVPPLMGRIFTDAEAVAGRAPVLLIGYDVWHSKFAADPGIVGREVRLGNTPHTIIGVMPEGFAFPVRHSFWAPLATDASSYERGQGPAIFAFGRLRPGVTMEQAQAELATLGTQAAASFPATNGHLQPRVMPYAHPIMDIQDIRLWQVALMEALVSMLLVIVAVNVAILVYARTATRRGEIAVRTALGASRRRIVGQLFIEALVLCSVAAVGGLLLARFGISQGHAIMEAEGAGAMPYWVDKRIPAVGYLYVAGLVLLAATIAGVLPALHATGRRAQLTLKEAGASGGLRLGGTWTALIVAQVAMAVAGLPMAVAIFGSEIPASSTAPAFAYESILTARLSSDPEPPAGVDPAAHRRDAALRMARLKRDLVEHLEADVAVADVALSWAPPGDEPAAGIEIDGMAVPASGAPAPTFNRVSVDFFDALNAPLLSGRWLTSTDARSETAPIVVNQAFVRKVLAGANPIGRRVRYLKSEDAPLLSVGGPGPGDGWNEIVGVVGNLFTNPMDPELVHPAIYHPLAESSGDPVSVLVRTREDGAAFAARFRELTMSLDPTVRLRVSPYIELQRQQIIAVRLILVALGLIIVSVLLLSAAGIYALMSFTVSQRRKEIGIRAAMGADGRQLLLSIFSRAAWQLAAGVAVGVALAVLIDVASGGEALGSGGRAMLPGMAAVMIVVGLLAAIGPARRGLRIEPTEALREN